MKEHFRASYEMDPDVTLLVGSDGLIEGSTDAETEIGFSLLKLCLFLGLFFFIESGTTEEQAPWQNDSPTTNR